MLEFLDLPFGILVELCYAGIDQNSGRQDGQSREEGRGRGCGRHFCRNAANIPQARSLRAGNPKPVR